MSRNILDFPDVGVSLPIIVPEICHTFYYPTEFPYPDLDLCKSLVVNHVKRPGR